MEHWRTWMINAVFLRIIEGLPTRLVNTFASHFVRINTLIELSKEQDRSALEEMAPFTQRGLAGRARMFHRGELPDRPHLSRHDLNLHIQHCITTYSQCFPRVSYSAQLA